MDYIKKYALDAIFVLDIIVPFISVGFCMKDLKSFTDMYLGMEIDCELAGNDVLCRDFYFFVKVLVVFTAGFGMSRVVSIFVRNKDFRMFSAFSSAATAFLWSIGEIMFRGTFDGTRAFEMVVVALLMACGFWEMEKKDEKVKVEKKQE
eukprot:TRINITY_DN12520_c0_g1_i1.p2 TRINITY_DN12520_c0_g1~~TRINITY_DN12520_c0_g1_i1.p2  ORF type:complete len:149 (-),score=44.83 TRINITY_DN12520_c0_g1_i1:322-768(-)